MNVTIQIANETINQVAQICQACNMTLLEQAKNEILKELWIKALTIQGWTLGVIAGCFMLGWILAGWYARVVKNENKRREKQ